MSDPTLSWLMRWYLSECDEDWEHSYGVKIDTLDNPGWSLSIDLRETSLEGRPFSKVAHGEPAGDLTDWRSLGSWWVADVEGESFKASCGPLDLATVIQLFRDWVEATTQE